MIDLYADNISLREIQVKRNEQILLFQNKEKDEIVALNISDAELLNILQKVKRGIWFWKLSIRRTWLSLFGLFYGSALCC